MSTKLFLWYACCLLCCWCNTVRAQSYLEFTENKGQWQPNISFRGELPNGGAFVLKPDGGYRILINDQKDFEAAVATEHKLHSLATTNNKQPHIRGHVYEVTFLGANPTPSILPEKQIETVTTYLNNGNTTATPCKTYTTITYQNIYPNIDVHYYTNNGNLKYDIIIHPGGDIAQIKMEVRGAQKLHTKRQEMTITTSVGSITENAINTYQIINDGRKITNCKYHLINDSVWQFRVPKSTSNKATLVIDPILIFSSFSGSKVSNWGYTATYDNQGNFYGGGIVWGAGFPVDNGSYDNVFGGGSYDIGIIKLNATGTKKIYATYIGGDGEEQPHSLVTDDNGNLIITGRTNSSNYPTTKQYGACGGYDIVLTKLNAAGSGIISSVRIGGTADDGVNVANKGTTIGCIGDPISGSYPSLNCATATRQNYGDDGRSEVILDNNNNVYIAAVTQSSDFPTAGGGTTFTMGGQYPQDAVFLKTSPDLDTLIYSTCLGGSSTDAAFSLGINLTNKYVYVSGGTISNDFPAAGGLSATFYGGACDGFISEFIPTGNAYILQRSTYLGTNGTDVAYRVQVDAAGNPYVMGTTTGDWTVANVAWSQAGGKQFIAKLNPDLSGFQFSTVFGSNTAFPNLVPTAFLVDRCGNLYVSGWGGNANVIEGYPTGGAGGLTTTADAYQATTSGSNFYLIVLSPNAGSLLYASFFGTKSNYIGGQDVFPDHVDGGTSRFDKNGIVYQGVCGDCDDRVQGNALTTSSNAYAPVNGAYTSRGCNFLGFKMAFNLAGTSAQISSTIYGQKDRTYGCVPLTVTFSDLFEEGKSYRWNFGDGSPAITTTTASVKYTYNTVGNYRAVVYAIDSSSCNVEDSSAVVISVQGNQATLQLDIQKQPPCASLSYALENNTTYDITAVPFTDSSFNLLFGDGNATIMGTGTVVHQYQLQGIYNVTLVLVDPNYCNYLDTLQTPLLVSTLSSAHFIAPPFGCLSDVPHGSASFEAIFTNVSTHGTYLWDFGDGTTSTEENPIHAYHTAGTYNVTLTVTDTATCNIHDMYSYPLSIYNPPSASFSVEPIQNNEPVVFINGTIGGDMFRWEFGDGDALITERTTQKATHIYASKTTYDACLIASTQQACLDTICQPIKALVTPLLAVANAFSPNGDGINDKIYVHGYAIDKLTWRVYNKNNTLVFQTQDKNEGWDGRYNGAVQPQDVYVYTLEVVFTNGEKYTKHGDITLLR